MPHLVKGGKYVFGWSVVNENGKIMVPEEAIHEYQFNDVEKIIIMPGSSHSGGFSITKPEKLRNSVLKNILNNLKYSEKTGAFGVPELNVVKQGKRNYCWTELDEKGYFCLSPGVLRIYGLKAGDRLLVVRGSGIGPGFVYKGKIVEEAKQHSELPINHT